MWAIRILNGPQAGEIFPLSEGTYSLGRSPKCDIQITAQGVSKQHCKIVVRGGKVFFSDLNSSNGTFINGVRIQDAILNNGDQFSFYNIMGDLQYGIVPQQQTSNSVNVSSTSSSDPSWDQSGSTAPQMDYMSNPSEQQMSQNFQENNKIEAPKNLGDSIQQYIEKVILPGVYQLGHNFEMKWLLGSFVIGFILLVTILSIIPMSQITKRSIYKESERRAFSIARQIIRTNKSAIASRQKSNLYVSFARKEDGVVKAFIVGGKDGSIWAPATEGTYANNSFIAQAIKESGEFSKRITNERIGVSIPFIGSNKNNITVNIAYAIVIYDIKAFASGDKEIFSLFFQTLFIAICIGLLIYFFMFQLIERPLIELKKDIEAAIQNGSSDVHTKFIFSSLKALLVPINSILSRVPQGDREGLESPNSFVDKDNEARGMIRIITNAAIAIDKDLRIISVNNEFENFCGINAINLEAQDVEALYDTSLIMNIKDLLERSSIEPSQIHTNEIPMNGIDYDLDVQNVQGTNGIDYFIITASLKGEG